MPLALTMDKNAMDAPTNVQLTQLEVDILLFARHSKGIFYPPRLPKRQSDDGRVVETFKERSMPVKNQQPIREAISRLVALRLAAHPALGQANRGPNTGREVQLTRLGLDCAYEIVEAKG